MLYNVYCDSWQQLCSTRNVERHICSPFLNFDSHCLKWSVNFKKISGNHFSIQGHCDLDLWPIDYKQCTSHVQCMCETYNFLFLRQLAESIYHSMSMWPSVPKINRGHPLVINNHLVKYENLMTNSLQDIQSFDIQGHCDYNVWPSDNKVYSGHLHVITNSHVIYMKILW